LAAGYQFMVALFGPFVYAFLFQDKVHDAFAQLRFHCRLPKSRRSYLIPRNETIVVCIYAKSCV
jgi:hypothetical protein